MWGYMFPTFVDALFPLATNPVEIAGRNRGWRKLIIDAITRDSGWKNGDYVEQPLGLANAVGIMGLVLYSPLQLQKEIPTAKAADRAFDEYIADGVKRRDANDLLYAIGASADYDPSPHLDRVAARLVAVNSADDFINPPELPMMRDLISRVRHGRFVSFRSQTKRRDIPRAGSLGSGDLI